ncbi:aminotransferase class V-fold PLP-dependent enzyme [Chryseobacterium carnipullorum]|uniref:Aminotransferase class V-fold PLP-dependent enzyme n=1 Tax=Chryseobacterium carnipullorum TaxID=1124835 RepID=A0A376DY43_CHRCU|nr:aminotransferase class I/II-fold pyridoxal phosphate-dependent enzyme [Chryseobacterium carnipullorum]AZA50091.1 aminotransferase class V-fold PLP-dependent enzyme [Chryseobacterium carnipullorum]AZA64967.1 aminotransferase class V-fold PLP-dependent enzyme [Chryseobacterium carnipullorum]STC97093.1 Low specificity L-threonine aldolase [Chryseobacterium carnipullorum]
MKFSFKNDYSEGCHPNILQALVQSNFEQQAGYGEDEYSLQAKKLIKEKIKNQDSEIYLVSGGTQANLIVISAILRPYQCVISAAPGHILNNETGAIEATGHKVLSIDTQDGKLRPSDIIPVLESHGNIPHQVMPKLVYISNSTELGTVYLAHELEELSEFCRQKGLYLFMDGARLGHGLTCEINDLTLERVAELTDIFYLGGTKNGALIGEAIVINNKELQPDFAFNIKQKGALLAKGRLLGIQFMELMKDDLYFDLAKHANVQAMKIKNAMKERGVQFLSDTYTNQIFPIISNELIEILLEHFEFFVWKKIDDQSSAIRLITSWNTSDKAVERFIEIIKKELQ